MSYTGVRVRDVGFIAWDDSLASLEKMKGAAWDSIIKKENQQWAQYVDSLDKRKIESYQGLLELAQNEVRPAIFKAGTASIAPGGAFSLAWTWNGANYSSRDIYAHPTNTDVIYSVDDIGDGSETFQLICRGKNGPIWKRGPIGPTIGIIGSRIYYLGAYNYLRYNRLYSCNMEDGSDERLLYEEVDVKCNLFLERLPDGTMYLISDNSGDKRVAFIGPRGGLYWVRKNSIPIGFTDSPNYIYTAGSAYVSSHNWTLPYGPGAAAIEWAVASDNGKYGWIVFRRHGQRELYYCGDHIKSIRKYIVHTGSIIYDRYYGGAQSTIRLLILTPDKPVHYINISRNSNTYSIVKLGTPSLERIKNLHVDSIVERSADGTEVHGRAIYSGGRPKAIMVIGYGAYGLPTNIGNCKSQWAPLLSNGWAIVYAFIRGGGDHTDGWTEGGRHLKRERSVEDFEAIIRAAQARFAAPTVIYGRSAGGLLVGATLNRGLVKINGVFTEVPYVDVLRTASNPTLPLTEMEYKEFGNPAEFLDFMVLSSLSPMDNITARAVNNAFVVCRSGQNDKEVLPYEPVKWITRLRAAVSLKNNPAPKLLAMENGEGHFYSLKRGIETRATDLALIEFLLGRV